MVTRTPSRISVSLVACLIFCFVLVPIGTFASATIQIIQGSGEFQTLQKAITVGAPEAISFRWSTDQAAAKGGTWKVTGPNAVVVASGESSPAPAVGHIATFTNPATGPGSFLKSPPPASPVKYSITIAPHDAAKNPMGTASPAVTVTQVKESPQQPVNFGPVANYPSIELVHYEENFGQVPQTQIFYATATVQLRGVNTGNVKTDPASVSVNDFNALWKQTGPSASIGALAPHSQSPAVTVQLTAMLPPPKSQLGQQQQIADWKVQYKNACGVDLRAALNWAGPQAQAPMNDHQEQSLYLGYGSSKSWDENHPVSTARICDDKQCVELSAVARSIYKQIACKVVGYAFFVGDKTSGARGLFGAFGQARTNLNPPAADFTPTTKMQIASTSKVLTALTGVRVFGNQLDGLAFTSFPSNWTLPQNTIVKNITFRQFLSHTSGVQQYYASQSGQDFNSLQTFFTQPIPNPNAPATCPGSGANPRVIPNPIVTNKAPCYTNTNFGIMRLVIPRFAGASTNDPTQLAEQYVQQVQNKVFVPVGVQNVACKPPANGKYALLYQFPGTSISGDWGDLTLVCGDWGWYVSVEDYAKVLVSLNSADHKILSDCQLRDMETNPAAHPVGWDIKIDNTGRRWLEKNGAEGTSNGARQTTSVGIFGGRSGCPANGDPPPLSGVAGVLFINSDIAGGGNNGAWTILTKAFQDSVKPKI